MTKTKARTICGLLAAKPRKMAVLGIAILFMLGLSGIWPVSLRPLRVLARDEDNFQPVIEQECLVTTEYLNLRSGPGLNHQVISLLKKDDRLQIYGAIGPWYVVGLADGTVGVVSNQYVKIDKIAAAALPEGDSFTDTPAKENAASPEQDDDESLLFGLVNRTRVEQKRQPFIWDENLNRIARLKAEDMVKNQYFSHNSPDYGTPFAMLKSMGVLYKTASENIAVSNDLESTHQKMLASTAHNANLTSARYNKMGVGSADNKNGGKVVVQLFIEE